MTTSWSVGFSYHLGWSCIAVAAIEEGLPGLIATGKFDTHEPGRRESAEPYHVAGGWEGLARVPVPGDPEQIVERGLQLQRQATYRNLAAFLEPYPVQTAGILVGRGRRAANLEAALNSHAQIHVAESHAVSDSIQLALQEMKIPVFQQDRKNLFSQCEQALGRDEPAMMSFLKQLQPENGPWRKEEKLCVIAAWLAATG